MSDKEDVINRLKAIANKENSMKELGLYITELTAEVKKERKAFKEYLKDQIEKWTEELKRLEDEDRNTKKD